MAFAFTAAKLNDSGGPGIDAEPPQVARSGDKVFLIWHEFRDAGTLVPDVFLARGSTGHAGLTFGPRINLSDSPQGDSRDERIAVTRSGNDLRVYVIWIEDGVSLRFRRDLTNDGSFAPAVTVNDTLGNVGTANAQVVADGNNVYVVWQAIGQNGDTDIFFARSKNSGDTFQDKLNLSNNPGTSEFPQLALLGDKQVVVTWRDDSQGAFGVFYARGRE